MRRDLRTRAQNLSLKAVSLGLERGCRFAVMVLAAPILGGASFGRLVFAATVTAILALLFDLGLGVWSTRALARGRPAPVEVVRLGLVLRALMTAPYALTVLVVAVVFAEGEARAAVVLLGVAAWENALLDHFDAILRGTERFAAEARLNTVRAISMIVLGFGALWLRPGLTSLALAVAVAAAVAVAFGFVVLLRIHPGSARLALDRPLARAALGESLPIWVAGLLSLVYFKVDTFFVRSFAGDTELGAYGAAYKLFEGAMLLPAVILAVTFPELVRTHDDPVGSRSARFERRLGGALVGLGLFVGAFLFVFRAPLVKLIFGASFERAEESLRVLSLGLPLVYLNFGLTHFLIARHRERVNTVLALLMLVVTVALDLALIPHGSGPGAATATVVAEIALTLGCLFALRGESGRRVALPEAREASSGDQTSA